MASSRLVGRIVLVGSGSDAVDNAYRRLGDIMNDNGIISRVSRRQFIIIAAMSASCLESVIMRHPLKGLRGLNMKGVIEYITGK